MNQAKQIQQLSADGVAIKEIVRRTGISRKTVRKYLRKIKFSDHDVRVTVSYTLPDNELAAIIYNTDSSPFLQQRFEVLIKHFQDKKDREAMSRAMPGNVFIKAGSVTPFS